MGSCIGPKSPKPPLVVCAYMVVLRKVLEGVHPSRVYSIKPKLVLFNIELMCWHSANR